MNEVFGKMTVTSREFPCLLFDAGETLYHFQPKLEGVYVEAARSFGVDLSEKQVGSIFIQCLKEWNNKAEEDSSFELSRNLWPENFAVKIGLTDFKKFGAYMKEVFSSAVKAVVPQTTVEVLEILKSRGFMLGVLSNGDDRLHEMFRQLGILDLFSIILTADEVGYSKPRPEIFKMALEDLGQTRAVHMGSSFAADILGARNAGLQAILYDPSLRELRALSPEEVSEKIVSIEKLRHNRRLESVRVISQFSELLEIFI